MASWAEVYFGARFKKVPDGWIFMGPSKRLFEKRDHYLVNDEQKATILAGAPSPGLILTFLGLVAVLGPALVVVFLAIFKSLFGHLPQGFLQQSPATIGLVTLVIVVSIAFFRNLDRRLLRVVADFPLSPECDDAARRRRRASESRWPLDWTPDSHQDSRSLADFRPWMSSIPWPKTTLC